jgi:peptidyl-prolyl cis-trans isomerase B (cyclophilin B)
MPTARQRREAQRRRLQRQHQRRIQQDVRRRRNSVIISVVGVLVIAAIIVTVVLATSDDSSTPPAGDATAAYPCNWKTAGSPSRQVTPPPTTTPPKSGTVNLLVSTSQGNMTFQLNRSLAPCAAASFESLAQQQFFNDTTCQRLTSGTLNVVQCGDPTGTGGGGPGYSFADELSGKEKYTRGVIAMANSGPDTNGSQFFIVYKNSTLSPKYTVFGKVTSGLDVVDKVAAKGSTPAHDGKPNLPLTLSSVAVVE